MQDIGEGGGGRFIGVGDRRLRQQGALKCPRCDSLNTKFCYYNNYNLSQPRHFCKSCRRYWTKGGVLRTVPVGGGCRKNKRSNSKARETKSHAPSSSSESSSLTAPVDSPILYNFPDANVNHDPDGQIGSLTSLMTSSEEMMMGFGLADISYGKDQQTVRVAEDPSDFKIAEALDWGSAAGDPDLFDLTAEVDPSYWSQSEWNDDHQGV